MYGASPLQKHMAIGLAYIALFLFYIKSVFKTITGQTSTNPKRRQRKHRQFETLTELSVDKPERH